MNIHDLYFSITFHHDSLPKHRLLQDYGIRPQLLISLMADMDSPFVTLSAGGMQPESLPDSSQDSVSLGDSETSVSNRISHCYIFDLADHTLGSAGSKPSLVTIKFNTRY